MSRDAPVDRPVHGLLQARWSPYVFDPARNVGEEDLCSLFEAARWTMSCFNEQPWRYIVGVRERNRKIWERVLSVLVPGNREWAKHAPVLALGIVEQYFSENGKTNHLARHDLGAATACLTVEAMSRNLHVHQMAGIEHDNARREFELPESLAPLTGIAIGYLGNAADAAEKYAQRDQRPRQRRAIEEFILHGGC